MEQQPVISVIIVNYNVKEYLEQALISIRRALKNIPNEIIVVDNASVDGSVPYIRKRFPDIQIIANTENLGFGKANNIALKQARGEFVVLINPDTVVQEDTFQKLLDFFTTHPDASAATCKIINPDGTFSVDCRHSIPTPMIAFWKVIGLSQLFPKSRIFGQYNLTYLDPNQTYTVPAISGSFMMIRRSVLEEVGYFDERFFMYCEDIDLCYRINQAGHKIYYVPTTQIIHYKGESTRKKNLDYIITFNKALYQFFQKYYAQRTILPFRILIVLGIILRGFFIYVKNFFQNHFPLLLDVVLLNLALWIGFFVRMEFKRGFHWEDFVSGYWVIHTLTTLLFLSIAFYLEVYPKHRLSVQAIIKTNVFTFMLLAALTFFLKQFAYSRAVVIGAAFLSPFFMITWRAILKRFYSGDSAAWGKDLFNKPTLLVGRDSSIVSLYRRIQEMRDLNYELLGVVLVDGNGQETEGVDIPVLGHLKNLKEIIPMYRIRQVIFDSDALSYEQILQTLSQLNFPSVEYKMIPSQAEFMIGKSAIERLDDYPFLEIDYAIGKPFNRFLKRLFDISVAGLLWAFMAPIYFPVYLVKRKKLSERPVPQANGKMISLPQWQGNSRLKGLNLWIVLGHILKGNISLVGAPILPHHNTRHLFTYWYKPGITGLVHLNQQKIRVPGDMERYHLFYVKNQSLLLDLEIFVKALWQRRFFLFWEEFSANR